MSNDFDKETERLLRTQAQRDAFAAKRHANAVAVQRQLTLGSVALQAQSALFIARRRHVGCPGLLAPLATHVLHEFRCGHRQEIIVVSSWEAPL